MAEVGLGVLGKAEISKLLDDDAPRKVFVGGTYDRNKIRAAAYDLRIAGDYLITPLGTHYWPKGPIDRRKLEEPFLIEPGEVAFVSSVEELRMPQHLAGNIATRFRSAIDGMLVMGGLLVDPGYHGRLHFQLANIGSETFTVRPGRTSVAAVQFLHVDGSDPAGGPIPNSEELLEKFFYEGADEPLPALAFFSETTALKGDVAKVKRRVKKQKVILDATRTSTDQLVVFGVFLISATLFGVAVSMMIEALSKGTYEDAGKVVAGTEFTLPGVVAAVAFLVAIGLVIGLMMRPVWTIVRARSTADPADED
jgi:deoxycytidine triphosphate deaminase